MNTPRTQAAGFSLIEVIAVLAILAILTVMTLPSFREQVLKSRRAEAREALHAVLLAQERHRSRSPRYADRLEDLGQPALSRTGLYRLRIVAADASQHAVEALAQGGQLGDHGCRILSLALEHGSVRTTGRDERGNEQPQACWPE